MGQNSGIVKLRRQLCATAKQMRFLLAAFAIFPYNPSKRLPYEVDSLHSRSPARRRDVGRAADGASVSGLSGRHRDCRFGSQ